MPTASGANQKVWAIAESTYGTPPTSPAMEHVRQTGCSLVGNVDTAVSEEYTGRDVTDLLPGLIKAAGNLDVEHSYNSHDRQIEAVLGGTWARTGTKTATTISAASSDNSINDSGGGFITAGFRVGDPVSIAGFVTSANNTLRATIATLTANKMTFTGTYGDAIVDESATPSVTINSLTYRVKTGSTMRSDSIIREFTDISAFVLFTGCKYDKWDLKVSSPEGKPIVTGTFGIMGQQVAWAAPSGATYGARTTTIPFTSIRGALNVGGSASSIVTEWGCSVANGFTLQPFVGSQITGEPVSTQLDITGNFTIRFQDITAMQAVIAGTTTSFDDTLQDAAGNKLKIVFPRLAYTGAPLDVKGGAPIAQNLTFRALYDTTAACSMYIERTPAA